MKAIIATCIILTHRHHPAALLFFHIESHQQSAPVPRTIILIVVFSAGAWSFSVSELAAPGVEVGRLTATDPDLGENAQLEFTILDTEEAEIFNITGRDQEAVIVLNKVSAKYRLVCV